MSYVTLKKFRYLHKKYGKLYRTVVAMIERTVLQILCCKASAIYGAGIKVSNQEIDICVTKPRKNYTVGWVKNK